MARVPGLFNPGSLLSAGGDPFLTLHREMNRLFDDVLRGGGAPAGGQGERQSGLLIAPSMDVSETDKDVRVKVELPGVSESDIDISLDEDVLAIRAEKKQERKEEREGVHFTERVFGTFQRSLRLPFRVDPDKVQARFENGVLTVSLAKTQPQERSRRIQIQGAQPHASIEQTQRQGQGSGETAGQSRESGAARGESG